MTDSLPDNGWVPDSEEWFLQQIAESEPDFSRLRDSIATLASRAAMAQAEDRAKLLQDTLAERGRMADALAMLRLRAAWMPESGAIAAVRDEIFAMIGPDTDKRVMAEHIGLDAVPAAEAVRRFSTLVSLRAASPCFDKTWGFGIVRRIDGFDCKVEIDFDSKPGHRMTFAYAAETLQPLDETHLLTRFHRDPDGIRRLAVDQPADVVRLALESFGPMAVPQLQDRLTPKIVPEASWKTFWDAARKAIRKGGLIDIPSKRTEPLRLRAAGCARDGAWADALREERSMPSILDRIETALREGAPDLSTADNRAAALDRLVFVIRGAGARLPGLTARCAIAADTMGLGDAADVSMDSLEVRWRNAAGLISALHDLPARSVRPFLDLLRRRMGGAFDGLALEALPQFRAPVLNEILDVLLTGGRETACAERIRELVASKKADVEVLLWLHRNPSRWDEWNLGRPFDFATLAIAAMEKDHVGERLKAQNALRERFAKSESLRSLFAASEADIRLALFLRLKESSAWPPLERQAILGRVVKLYPELEDVLRNEPRVSAARLPVTSARSYRERAEQLRKLIEVDIPQNSRDIGVARSYGDLRENFEYKAAKEMQGILLRRRGELEQALKSVQPTDFDGPTPERAGPGAGVEIETADGAREIFFILGAWDRDEALGIVSSDTQLARALDGKGAGEAVVVPDAAGEGRPARIAAIHPLSKDVRAWVKGDAG